MTFIRKALLASAALALPAAPALADHHAEAAAEAVEPQTERDKLFALFEESNERSLELNPLSRIFRGDSEGADRLGDYLTDSYFLAGRLDTQLNLAMLAQIDRSKLDPTDQLAYDVFKYNEEQSLAGSTDEIRALTEVRPVDHFSGFHTFYPNFSSGKGAAPFKTVANYEDNLSRHDDYIAYNDRAIARFREGMESGVLETSLTIGIVIEQLTTQIDTPLEDSQFMGPTTMFPADFSDADKARLTAAYRAKTEELYASHRRLRDFLRDEYLPVARDSIGLSQMKGGDKLYAQMIEQTTTLPLTADYLHDLGLSEVARIKSELEKIRVETGFAGTLNEFFEFVRTDAQFKPESREALTQTYYDIGKQVDAKIGDYFSLLPKSELKIEPYDPSIEQFQAGGSYRSGTPDGSRPGVFYFNAYDLPSRLTTGNMTLYLHEGAPGHHFQISLAQENEALPAFMRFGGTTAFIEGWALYAETLGYEMGFFEDPWNRYGTLQDEQLRAMRLVVDTGIHAKGWTRQQAVDFMLENSGMTRTEVVAEVDRYIAIPSQALGYKVGALKIQELRERASKALGKDFDIREFHAQVLNTGGLPLAVLEAKIDRWIAEQKGA
ncbi:DUF885 domain-containing protein [Altererythrobacter arenosus]|uniref:DUF885 domain-containing protein n=1 Tax=Altererythrobacter arenosus TaxID=3032592 RepID=A0ABY8FN67_9SPHN|nr:DUF885 domain-containing protein [Altererythrobacter sp. CAU 1644]WFL76222.1 DUF885 domain-containing protein [Altererythrobacter sp. CAU 1644]